MAECRTSIKLKHFENRKMAVLSNLEVFSAVRRVRAYMSCARDKDHTSLKIACKLLYGSALTINLVYIYQYIYIDMQQGM